MSPHQAVIKLGIALQAGFGYLASHAPSILPQIGNNIVVVTPAGFYYIFTPL
jgi:hypothetical protein